MPPRVNPAPSPPSRRHWAQAPRPPGFRATWARADRYRLRPPHASRAIGMGLARRRQPFPHPQRAERNLGRRPKLFAGLRKRALGDHARQDHAATQGTEELIQPDLQRSAANPLEQECDQDLCAQTAFAGEVRRADTMGCNKLSRTQQIADISKNAGTDFEFFPYCEIFRFLNEDGQRKIIDHSLNLMALAPTPPTMRVRSGQFMQSFIRTLTGYAQNAHKIGILGLRRTRQTRSSL